MEKLTLPARIHGFIKRLQDQRSLLTVVVDGKSQEFNSAVIDVSTDDNTFTLDELIPEEGHKLLAARRKCHVKGIVDGVSLNFSAEIQQVNNDDKIPSYTAKIPGEISYLQRRAAHRVKVGIAKPVSVEVKTQGGSLISGYMSDLSIGGLRIRFDQTIEAPPATGDVVECKFAIGEIRINCSAIVRFIKAECEKSSPAALGCQFTNLIKPQERGLQRLVMNLERAARQKE